MKPVVNETLCDGCGECVSACPVGLFKLVNGKSVVQKGDCLGCRACEAMCPKGAIEVID